MLPHRPLRLLVPEATAVTAVLAATAEAPAEVPVEATVEAPVAALSQFYAVMEFANFIRQKNH